LVSPKATIDALIPGMNYFAAWSILGVVAAAGRGVNAITGRYIAWVWVLGHV
jgi:hypothetical protein